MGAAVAAGVGGILGSIVGALAGTAFRPYRESDAGIKAWKRRHAGTYDYSNSEVLWAMSSEANAAIGAGAAIGALVGAVIGAKLGELETSQGAATLSPQGGT